MRARPDAPTLRQRKRITSAISFEHCVVAIAEVVTIEDADRSTDRQIASVAAFLLEVQARMPDYLRLVFRLLTLVFDASSIVTRGKPFHRLPLAERRQLFERWERSFIPPLAAFASFYRTFGTFCLSAERFGEDYDPSAFA